MLFRSTPAPPTATLFRVGPSRSLRAESTSRNRKNTVVRASTVQQPPSVVLGMNSDAARVGRSAQREKVMRWRQTSGLCPHQTRAQRVHHTTVRAELEPTRDSRAVPEVSCSGTCIVLYSTVYLAGFTCSRSWCNCRGGRRRPHALAEPDALPRLADGGQQHPYGVLHGGRSLDQP